MIPVVRHLVAINDELHRVQVSVDTFRPNIARTAIEAGATIINDVWGLRIDPQSMKQVIYDHLDRNIALILMHNPTTPNNVRQYPAFMPLHQSGQGQHADVVSRVHMEMQLSILDLAINELGIPRWMLILDPGIGFGKSIQEHLSLVHNLQHLKHKLGPYPLLIGASRKGFIGKVLGSDEHPLPIEERLEGTLAFNAIAIDRGADFLRVHDVKANSRLARMIDAIRTSAVSE